MKGVVFNLLEETVTRSFGANVWDDLIEASGVSGAYTSLGNYPDEEIEALGAAASVALSLDRNAVLRWFGHNAIPVLAELYPSFFEGVADARTFVEGVNNIIHAEVRKLYPGAACPHFRLHADPSGDLVMDYLSARDMCALAQGFVEGVAVWFGQSVEFRHLQCKQQGHDHCTFAMTWAGEAQRSVAA